MYPPAPDGPADFPHVFAEERQRIRAWRHNRGVSADDGGEHLDLVGLAFSGGGIRSATFNLGVLQALAKLEILRYVDYLSTVSGGGYVGGWLAAMLHRLAGGMQAVEDGLDPDQVNQDNLPQKAIAHLRAYSNYLTPKVSALSADTWSLFTIWSRNTLLNLVTLVSGIAALILFGRLVGLNSMLPKWTAPIWVSWAAFAAAAVMLALNLSERLPGKLRNDSGVQCLVVLPALAGAVLMTFQVYARPIQDRVPGGIVLSVLFLALQLLAGFWGRFLHNHQQKGAAVWNVLLQLGVAVVSGFVTTWLFYAVSRAVAHFAGQPAAPWLVLTLGPPAMLAAVSLGVIVNVGLMGRDLPDRNLEWLGRLGAWAMIYGAAWLLFFGLAFFGPLGLTAAWTAFANWARTTVTLAWLATTVASLLAAKSAKTGSEQSGGAMNLVALVGPWVFLLAFVSLIGLAVQNLTLGNRGLLELMLLAIAVSLVMAWRVDINEFSLHHFYKNRLARCYLGASRSQQDRHPNPFTNFDPQDDFPLNHLDDPDFSGPFPIINATLNLSSGRNLAWQERKGASFIFTPVYSGYDTRIVQCKMILKWSSFPMQDDPEIGILPRCQVDANLHGECRGAEPRTNR